MGDGLLCQSPEQTSASFHLIGLRLPLQCAEQGCKHPAPTASGLGEGQEQKIGQASQWKTRGGGYITGRSAPYSAFLDSGRKALPGLWGGGVGGAMPPACLKPEAKLPAGGAPSPLWMGECALFLWDSSTSVFSSVKWAS